VPDRCKNRLKDVIGSRAIGLTGELRLSGKKYQPASSVKMKGLRVPFQPGLIHAIKITRPEIIITDGFFQWTYAALWLRLWQKVPHLMCYEATAHTEKDAGWFRVLYRRWSSRLIDHISCNGSLSRKYILSLGYPAERISIGNMAVDVEDLHVKSSQMTENEKTDLKLKTGVKGKLAIFIGRLVPLKGVDKLIEAWRIVYKNNVGIQLLIIGDGDKREEYEKGCLEKGLSNVLFVGNIEYDSIYKYLSIADLFIIPTLRDNWSLVVPEAMSCGLPVICSKYNGCWPELVKSENGWVFDPLDPVSFSETLKIAWNSRKRWKEMGRQSLKIIRNYSPDKIAESIYLGCAKITN